MPSRPRRKRTWAVAQLEEEALVNATASNDLRLPLQRNSSRRPLQISGQPSGRSRGSTTMAKVDTKSLDSLAFQPLPDTNPLVDGGSRQSGFPYNAGEWRWSTPLPPSAAEPTAKVSPNAIARPSFPLFPAAKDPASLADVLLQRVKPQWRSHLETLLLTPQGLEVLSKYQQALKYTAIFPSTSYIFRAFQFCDLDETRAVILGQDPYFQPGQATGLSFSVPTGAKVPRTLRQIFKELGIPQCENGDLTPWARQGVLLLNTVLTVAKGRAGSHNKLGWQFITDHVIELLGSPSNLNSIVFMLWGNHAQKRRPLIDGTRHLILASPHPSPQTQGFLGCDHFHLCNLHLEANGRPPIDWLVITRAAETEMATTATTALSTPP